MKFFISIIGWALWNWIELTIKKSELDEDGNTQTNFSFKEFASVKWTYWIGSFLCIFLLIWFGMNPLGLDPFGSMLGTSLTWNDGYYLLSGATFEASK